MINLDMIDLELEDDTPYCIPNRKQGKFKVYSHKAEWVVMTNYVKTMEYPHVFQSAYWLAYTQMEETNSTDDMALFEKQVLENTIKAMNHKCGEGYWHKYQLTSDLYTGKRINHISTKDSWISV